MDIYDNKYTSERNWTRDSFGVFTSADEYYFESELKRLCRKHPPLAGKPLRILEVGYGNGKFMGWCKSMGFEVSGLEINPELIDRARQHSFTVFSSFEDLNAACTHHFDLVIAFDVLEHIPRQHLSSFIMSAKAKLTTNGCILVRFPNGDNPFALYLQNGDITHQTAIGKYALYQLAGMNNLAVIYYGTMAFTLRGALVSNLIKMLIVIPLRVIASLMIRVIFTSGRKIDLAPNIVSILTLSAK